MRKAVTPLLATVILASLAPSEASAGILCSIFPSLCPPAPSGTRQRTPVPEPATLFVLAAGACAAGLAARRSRKK